MRRMGWRLVAGLLAVLPVGMTSQAAWEPVETGVGNADFQAVAAHPVDADQVVAATQRAVYASAEDGEAWRPLFRTPAHRTISRLASRATPDPTLLLATDEGLYGSFDAGRRWQRLFRGRSDGSAVCTAVAFHPSRPAVALLGTRNGLFLSEDGGRHWRPLTVPPSARAVVDVAFDPQAADAVYLVAEQGLFAGRLAESAWEQRFGAAAPERAEETAPAEETDAAASATAANTRLTAVAVDPETPSRLYLASTRGLWHSEDAGRSWQRLPRSGLTSVSIVRLLARRSSPLTLYAATGDALARYAPEHERWHLIASRRVNDLAATAHHLWAATDRGLFRAGFSNAPFAEDARPAPQELLANFVHEPTIAQVREAAIRYAEVHPSKISAWRAQARAKALVPKLSVTTGTNLTDFRHWDSGSSPDTLLRGERDLDWDVSISWELADLIWSDAQTSIDVRSKLMVELRDDLLDDVTRTYFERRRLQVALLTSPPADPQRLLEQELRVQELTALIDNLTDGAFSRRMALPAATPEVRYDAIAP